MAVLWLRFLTEINTNTEHIPADLQESPEINKALEELKTTGFTEEELRAYEKLLDNIRVERTLQQDSYDQGVEQGIEIGIEQGKNKEKLAIAKKCFWQDFQTPKSYHSLV